MDSTQFQHAFHLAPAFRRSYETASFGTPALQSIGRAFARNMNRVRGIGAFPIKVIALATLNEAARVEALVNKHIPLHDLRITAGHPKFDQKLYDEVGVERSRIIKQWQDCDPHFKEKVAFMGINGLNQILESTGAENLEAVQAA